MSLVTLFSGGLDSTLIAVMAKEEKIDQHLLFIDYGQLCCEQEWTTCLNLSKNLALPTPERMNLHGFGKTIKSGLTCENLDINEDAFLPGRNLLFLVMGAAFAYRTGSNAISIGLLSEDSHLFPDQTLSFVQKSQNLINEIMYGNFEFLTPLINYSKKDVLKLAKMKGIQGTRSCHNSLREPCEVCISCLEISGAKKNEV